MTQNKTEIKPKWILTLWKSQLCSYERRAPPVLCRSGAGGQAGIKEFMQELLTEVKIQINKEDGIPNQGQLLTRNFYQPSGRVLALYRLKAGKRIFILRIR